MSLFTALCWHLDWLELVQALFVLTDPWIHIHAALLRLENNVSLKSPTTSTSYSLTAPLPHRSMNPENRVMMQGGVVIVP